MKPRLPIALLLVVFAVFACKTDGVKNQNFDIVDTVSVSLRTDFGEMDLPPDWEHYQLIRTIKGDSTITFSYYSDSMFAGEYAFNTVGHFDIINKSNEQYKLFRVDSLVITFKGEALTIYKFEIENPPIDGHKGLIFSEKYGLMISSSYSWLNHTYLTNWNETIVQKEMEHLIKANDKRLTERTTPFETPPKPIELE
jgi:hypothetical protein